MGGDIDGKASGDGAYTSGDWSGFSVSLSADGAIIAIGSPKHDIGWGNEGQVRVYENVQGVWGQIGADINGKWSYDRSGYSVSLSADGSVVVIGAPGNQNGYARVYQNIQGKWTQGVEIADSTYDEGGYSVSLSGDGTMVAIGAPGHNVGSYSDEGTVRVFQRDTNLGWTQLAQFDGEAKYDNSGTSVSLSADGSTVAIGAIGNDDGGDDAGTVRVYSLSSDIVVDGVCTSCPGVSKWDGTQCSHAYIKTNLQQLIDMRCSGDTDANAAAAAFAELQQPCA